MAPGLRNPPPVFSPPSATPLSPGELPDVRPEDVEATSPPPPPPPPPPPVEDSALAEESATPSEVPSVAPPEEPPDATRPAAEVAEGFHGAAEALGDSAGRGKAGEDEPSGAEPSAAAVGDGEVGSAGDGGGASEEGSAIEVVGAEAEAREGTGGVEQGATRAAEDSLREENARLARELADVRARLVDLERSMREGGKVAAAEEVQGQEGVDTVLSGQTSVSARTASSSGSSSLEGRATRKAAGQTDGDGEAEAGEEAEAEAEGGAGAGAGAEAQAASGDDTAARLNQPSGGSIATAPKDDAPRDVGGASDPAAGGDDGTTTAVQRAEKAGAGEAGLDRGRSFSAPGSRPEGVSRRGDAVHPASRRGIRGGDGHGYGRSGSARNVDGGGADAASPAPASSTGRRSSSSSSGATQSQLLAYRAGLSMLVKLADQLAAAATAAAVAVPGSGMTARGECLLLRTLGRLAMREGVAGSGGVRMA